MTAAKTSKTNHLACQSPLEGVFISTFLLSLSSR
jgi:hypothetical protein